MKTIVYLIIMTLTTVVSAQSFFPKESKLKEKIRTLNAEQIGFSTQLLNNPVKQLDSLIAPYTGSDPIYQGVGFKYLYEYDKQNNSVLLRTLLKGNLILPYDLLYKIEKFYDNNDNLIEEQTIHWDQQDNNFSEGEGFEYTYNNNQLIEKLHYLWFEPSQYWFDYKKHLMIYDSSNKLIGESIKVKLNNQWLDAEKVEYTYDSSNMIVLKELYDSPTYGWNIISKTEYTYNTNGELIQELKADFFNNNWVNDYKFNVIYQPNQITYEYYSWAGFDWRSVEKIERFFDQSNNLTMEINYEGNQYSQIFDPNYKEIFTYNNNYQYAELRTMLEEWECQHQLVTYAQEYHDGLQFIPFFEGNYYWLDLPTSVSDISAGVNHHIYPNPASNVLNFELPQSSQNANIQLFNASGQLIANTQFIDNKLEVSTLPQGLYTYLIRQGDEAFSGKVIISK